ncbi:flagellar protein FlaI [Natronorubrum sediminis]|uniref:Flagellar protein FlaI n=1 Tax=Natronorubrum sediminis TaxID=640943 RepID=A0A1H6FMV5_9EURY|nr:ATPase, T2SS/T4P/T4SS family [Natronorubrum sediminis]SEH12249.1 flagellar protein FlaI [Natronorubrum sediminis]
MAIDDADQSDSGDFSEREESDLESGADADANPSARVGEYTWEDFMIEHGYGTEVSTLYPDEPTGDEQLGLDTDESQTVPTGADWDRVDFDPTAYLGIHPDDLRSETMPVAGDNADVLQDIFLEYVDPETTPVTKDVWTWEHYKWEYYYDDDGSRPRDGDGEIIRHDKEEALGFDPETLEQRLFAGDEAAMELDELVEERTVNIQDEIDEDDFFSSVDGNTTVSNRYDLEKAVPMDKKTHFREVERYWVNKPYAYVVIFHSEKENEKKYYMVEPYLNEIELELQEFLSGKLRTAIKYSDDGIKEKATEDGRRVVIEDEARRLLKRYDLFEKTGGGTQQSILETFQSLGDLQSLQNILDDESNKSNESNESNESDESDEADEDGSAKDDTDEAASEGELEPMSDPETTQLEGIEVRPEPAILADDPDTLNEYQVEKLLYQLKRNFIGYERIDGIKHDINVEDVSCDGYNSPVFVYHSEYEQIISNIYHGDDELDDFVVKLAQRSGKGISKRLPQVDATLPDGSRAQLTLGQEVSDHGTNYTIRQFKDVPFTPIDLINWNTFSLDEMAFLWLAIENHKSLIFAGGTASGKTTSLNAVSLFIPSSAKIVSIEDTREVELPQRNWIASVTRPSFSDDEQGDVDEFDLLEAALRQRPDYIVMGEIRGEEGRTLFQVMSTGHTTYTTFHADSVDEVLKRFTTDPINVSKTMFTALDLVSIQTQTRVQGRKVRRNKSLTEINHYEAEHDEINVQDVYQWQAETDEYLKMGDSNTLDEIQFDRGWSNEKLQEELFKREVILAYLIKNGLNTYAEVAATAQAFINDPDTILTLIANGQLEESLTDLREMESVLIDVDQEKEELVPRPDASSETYNLSMDILERAEESLFEEYRGKVPSGLASALGNIEDEEPIDVEQGDGDAFDFEESADGAVDENEWELDDGSSAFGVETADGEREPAWLSDDTGFEIGASGEVDTTADASASSSREDQSDSNQRRRTADTQSAETAVEQSSTGAGESASTPAASTPNESATIFPSDDPDEDDLGGLFDDMGETIDQLESTDSPAESKSLEAEPSTDNLDTESLFPDGDFESIFDPDGNDPSKSTDAGSKTDDIETAIRDVQSEDTAVNESPSTTSDSSTTESDESESDDTQPADAGEPDPDETESIDPPTIELGDSKVDDTESADPPTIELGDSKVDDTESADPPTIELGDSDEEENESVDPPTIELGDASDDDQDEATENDEDDPSSSPEPMAGDPTEAASSGETSDDEAIPAAPPDSSEEADVGEGESTTALEDGDADDNGTSQSEGDVAEEDTGEDASLEETANAAAVDTGGNESLFEDETDSVFSETDETPDDDDSLFDSTDQVQTDDSIFSHDKTVDDDETADDDETVDDNESAADADTPDHETTDGESTLDDSEETNS